MKAIPKLIYIIFLFSKLTNNTAKQPLIDNLPV